MSASSKKLLVGLAIVGFALAACSKASVTDTTTPPAENGAAMDGEKKADAAVNADAKVDATAGTTADTKTDGAN